MSYEGKGSLSNTARSWDGEKWIEQTSLGRAGLNASNNPLGLWNFNGDLTDSSGNGKTLTEDSTSVFNSGPTAGTQSFDTITAVNAANRVDTDFDIKTALTVQVVCFFNSHPAVAGVTAYNPNVSADTEVNNSQWQIFLSSGSILYGHESGAGTNQNLDSGVICPLHTWVHLAFTRASNGIDIKIFLNGSKILDDSAGAAPTGGTNAFLRIGTLDGTNDFIGLISTVKINTTELSEFEILEESRKALGY